MKVIKTGKDWLSVLTQFSDNQTIGFVPTMGALHDGHGALLKQSIDENDVTVLSIFINPKQFNQQSDYETYPRNYDDDINFADSIGVDFVFMPSVDEMYPNGQQAFSVDTMLPISQIMEGKSRPGHFKGMLTIVLKLLLLIKPTRAYFGEKDYQQLALVKTLVSNFYIPCEIVGCPIIREVSGLAMSSRNKRLSQDGYQKAQKMAQVFHHYGQIPEPELLSQLADLDVDVEYLQKIDNRVYLAAWIEGVRLIDNIPTAN